LQAIATVRNAPIADLHLLELVVQRLRRRAIAVAEEVDKSDLGHKTHPECREYRLSTALPGEVHR